MNTFYAFRRRAAWLKQARLLKIYERYVPHKAHMAQNLSRTQKTTPAHFGCQEQAKLDAQRKQEDIQNEALLKAFLEVRVTRINPRLTVSSLPWET